MYYVIYDPVTRSWNSGTTHYSSVGNPSISRPTISSSAVFWTVNGASQMRGYRNGWGSFTTATFPFFVASPTKGNVPRGFARVRTFGWLHPAAKVRGNRVRALLRQAPWLTPAEQETWKPPVQLPQPASKLPVDQTTPVACAAPLCPRCQKVMRRIGSWRPGQPMLLPPSCVVALRSVDKRPP